MARYPPEMILLACLIVAIKAENLGEPIRLSHIFHDAQQVNVVEVFKFEPIVLGVLEFQILILHTQTPLMSLTHSYFRYRQKIRDYPPGDNPDKDLQTFCSTLQTEGEKLSVEVYESQLPFIRSPSELAIGIFLLLLQEKGCNKPDPLEFVSREWFPTVHHPADGDSVARFRNQAIQLQSDIFEFRQHFHTFEQRWEQAKALQTIKELRKWNIALDKGTWAKRKKTEPAK